MSRSVFPGSFDPITLGHVDIVKRALPLFDEIIIAVGANEDKSYMFSLEERASFIQKTFQNISKVKVCTFEGLTVNFCKKIRADAIVRGLRNPADFEFEKAIAQVNRKMSGIETIFFLTAAQTAPISSSIVREIIKHKGDYTIFVPETVRVQTTRD